MTFRTRRKLFEATKDIEDPEVKQSLVDKLYKAYINEEVSNALCNAHLRLICDSEYKKCIKDMENGIVPFPGVEQYIDLYKKHTNGNGGNYHANWFITVNPKDGVDLRKFIKAVEKYTRRSMLTNAEYVFEQRGDSDSNRGRGFHTHMLVTQNGKYNDKCFRDNTYNTFKNFVGNQQHVYMYPVTGQAIEDKRSYMKGNKTGDGKDIKVIQDAIWRSEINISSYYIYPNANQEILQETSSND